MFLGKDGIMGLLKSLGAQISGEMVATGLFLKDKAYIWLQGDQ